MKERISWWKAAGLPINEPAHVASVLSKLLVGGSELYGLAVLVEDGRAWEIE